LYAIGGDTSWFMERYDPTTDQWQYVARPNFYDVGSSMTTHNGRIYLCNEIGFEVYSPAADAWQTLTLFKDCILQRALVSTGDQLLALGGRLGLSKKALKSVFSYNVSNGQWSQLPDMPAPRRDFKAFLVEISSN